MISGTTIHFRGITWSHTRGYLPMVATAQRFAELNPEVAIQWDVRSLQEFADRPLEELVRSYDFLIVDHPFTGPAALTDVLLQKDTVKELNGRLRASRLEQHQGAQ